MNLHYVRNSHFRLVFLIATENKKLMSENAQGCFDPNWLTSIQSPLEVAAKLKAVVESGKITTLYNELDNIHPDGPALYGRYVILLCIIIIVILYI